MQTTPLSKEQSELVGELSEASQRMNRLNKALLILAKIENNQFPGKDSMRIDEITEKLLLQYADSIEHNGLRIERDQWISFSIEANPTLLEILINNLISNAILHNKSGGSIRISLENNLLKIANEGIASPLDKGKLFQRFKKQVGGGNGTGLGLEIVKKICQVNNWNIEYQFQIPFHTFIIHFN